MLKYPCLVMDHDDTVVQSEATVNYPFFRDLLGTFRPGRTITLEEYTDGCYRLGFAEMCHQWYGFTEAEIREEFCLWQAYIQDHTPAIYPGIDAVLRRQRAEGGKICVVSHSSQVNIRRDYLRHFGFLPDQIYGWDLPPHQRKPSTYPIEQILKSCGYDPRELLIVDDMRPAYEMGRSAGVEIAFAAWGRLNSPEILSEMTSICDYSFYSTKELEKFLFE